jgi:hypothetical protein
MTANTIEDLFVHSRLGIGRVEKQQQLSRALPRRLARAAKKVSLLAEHKVVAQPLRC